MKTARFLFTIVVLGALTPGLNYAGEPSKLPAEPKLRQIHPTTIRPADRAHDRIDQAHRPHSSLINPGPSTERSSQVSPKNNQTKSASGNPLHQPGMKKAPTAGNDGLMLNNTANHHQRAAKLPVGTGSTTPWTGVVRSRNATAALVGRVLITSNAKYSAGPLDGAAVKRKP
jgi:hypothetical protein